MALFSNGPATPPANGVPKERRRNDPHGLSIVASDLVISGDLDSQGVIKVEGRVAGAVRAGSQVLVAPGAVIDGDLHTREAVVGGTIRGSIQAAERVEIQPNAVVEGDIVTRNLLVHEGGRVNGTVTMRMDGTPDLPLARAGLSAGAP